MSTLIADLPALRAALLFAVPLWHLVIDPQTQRAEGFALAALQAFEGDFGAAFDQLLEVVLRDKAEGKPDRERARKQLIDWFVACPDAEAVSRGRRYLGMYLN